MTSHTLSVQVVEPAGLLGVLREKVAEVLGNRGGLPVVFCSVAQEGFGQTLVWINFDPDALEVVLLWVHI